MIALGVVLLLAAHSPQKPARALTDPEIRAAREALEGREPEFEQAFHVSFSDPGDRMFVPIKSKSRPETRCAYALLDDARKVTELESWTPESWACDEILGVGFPDLDADGKLDVVLVRSYMTGIGPTGAIPFTIAEAWLNKGGGKFEADPALNDSLEKKKAASLADVKKIAKARFTKK